MKYLRSAIMSFQGELDATNKRFSFDIEVSVFQGCTGFCTTVKDVLNILPEIYLVTNWKMESCVQKELLLKK